MTQWRQRGLAFAFAILAIAALSKLFLQDNGFSAIISQQITIAAAVSIVVLASSVLLFLSSFDQGRTNAWLRLDWFWPALRRIKPDQSPSHSLIGRLLRRITPISLQSDHKTKRRGWFRKTIRKFGLSWSASPIRRISQTVCMLVFLGLFFYVCWPYDARPAANGQMSKNWTFQTIDQESGEFSFLQTGDSSETDWLNIGQSVFLVDSSDQPAPKTLAELTIVKRTEKALHLIANTEVAPETFDLLFGATGTFKIHQHDPNAWPSHYADNLANKERIPAETFLVIDPLVSLSTAIASRSWVWSLVCAAAILIVCILIPRGFCGYICPLGTTIDFFDWAIAGRTKRFQVPGDGWWVHIKYYLLAGTLVAATCGVLLTGFVSAIPVITRALLFLVDPIQSGSLRGWHLLPAINAGHLVSLVLFFTVLGLGFLRPRFWCKYVCPSGAVFSLGNLFRCTERKVESSCINCNKCVEICPFDAIKPDFTTRTSDCTMCQSCGGVCPTHAIKFVERWNVVELKIENDPPTNETALGRRGFLSLAAGSAAAVTGGIGLAGATKVLGANLDDPNTPRPVRPPGSVPEQEFLEMCIRCGECFKACPNNVLQPQGFQQGLEGLWSPIVNANWAGCESSCNACGQVCPTGAIRALPIEEKRVARMGLAIVNESTCLPLVGKESCDLCVQECNAAGYEAIEFKQVLTEVDDNGFPIEGTGFLAPVVLEDKCVGCGLCQTRCYGINVKEKHLLSKSAIIIEAGEGKEDRLMNGSYRAMRESESAMQPPSPQTMTPKPEAQPDVAEPDPFGVADDPFGVNEDPADVDTDPFGLNE